MKKYTQALSQPSPQQPHPSKNTIELNHANPPPSKHTSMKHTQEEPTPYMYDTLQLLFPTTHYETTTANDYINKFPLYTAPQYITQKKHPSHDSYLYHHCPLEQPHCTQAQDQEDPYKPTPLCHQG